MTAPARFKLRDNVRDSVAFYKKMLGSTKDPLVYKEIERELVRNDLFYLMIAILNRRDMLHPWLFARCREVQLNPNGYLDLWSREHRKTSIISIALTIQDILRDPEITIGFFSHTRPIAKSLLRQIKREFEGNERLKILFDDVLYKSPEKESPTWSEDNGIIVKRKTNPKEATVEAWGLVDGMPTGRHFKLRVYDDVVTRESVTTKEQVDKTTEAWELSDNLGIEDGWVRIIGTRYSLYDTYDEIIKRGAAIPRVYAATDNGKMDGNPVLFSEKEWERRKKTQSRFSIASQMLQNPLADEDATFRAEWLRPYEVRPRTLNVAILCDPSKGLNASSDNTAIAVVGISAQGGKYLLDGYRHRMTLSQRWACLRDLYQKWSAEKGVMQVAVGYERYGAQSDDEYFQERMKIENIFFEIEEVSWVREGTKGQQGKTARVERLEPDFRNSRFYLPLAVLHNGKPCTWSVDRNPESKTFNQIIWRDVEGLTKQQLQAIESGSQDLVARAIKRVDEENKVYDLTDKFMEEYLYFPFGEYKDLVDATSRIYDIDIQPPVLFTRSSTEPNQFFDS